MDTKARIETAKANSSNWEKIKIATETQLEAAEKQQAELVAEMQGENVSPETIEGEMAKEEAAALEYVEKAEKLMPQA